MRRLSPTWRHFRIYVNVSPHLADAVAPRSDRVHFAAQMNGQMEGERSEVNTVTLTVAKCEAVTRRARDGLRSVPLRPPCSGTGACCNGRSQNGPDEAGMLPASCPDTRQAAIALSSPAR